MAALTIHHDGLIASGQTVVGTGRPGSVGIHILPGLDLVVLDGFTVKGFDVGILAESPVVLVNCEILRYGMAGVVLNAGVNYVEFCSFLDQTATAAKGACILAGASASGINVANNVFQVEGANRYFGLGYRVAWVSRNNLGIAAQVFGVTGDGRVDAIGGITERALDGVIEDSPMYARTTLGEEVLLLISSSPAIRSALSTLLPAIDNHRFDAQTRMPKVDRKANKRAVEFLSAGAHEMSFAVTQVAKVRILELISGISSMAFDHAASGRNGVFVRLPNTNSNPTPVAVEDPRDIQPSTDMAVLSFADKLFGSSSAYFKPERLLKVPFLVAASPSRKSNLDKAGAVTFMAAAKALSTNADVLLSRDGEGRAQDQPVIEVSLRFQGSISPTMRLKLGGDQAAYDYAFVVEDVEAIEAVESAIAEDAWCFFGWSFDGLAATFFFGRYGDAFLRTYSSRAYVFDSLNEVMVPAQGDRALTSPRTIVDGNDQPTCVGSDQDRRRGWHGYIADVRLDIGESLDRAAMEAEFLSGEKFNDIARVSKQITQTDLLIARTNNILIRVPGAPAGPYAGGFDEFALVRKIVLHGDDLIVAGRRSGGVQEGVHVVSGGEVSTLIDNIPTVYDIAVDRHGNLVILASDEPVSRIDFSDGERRALLLDSPPLYGFKSIAVSRNGDYVVGDFSESGGRLVLVHPTSDVADVDPASTEVIDIGSETVEEPVSITVTDSDEIFVLDAAEPKVLKVSTWKLFQTQVGLDVDVAIAAGQTLASSSIDFAGLGLLPGDRLAFVSSDEDLKTSEGESVAVSGDPTVPDNAGEFIVSSVSGFEVELDREMVSESPSSGRQFELRMYRRNSTALAVHRGLPLVAPNCIAFNQGDPSNPILISDPQAVRADFDPMEGVIFSITNQASLTAIYYRANLGFDLSAVSSLALHPNKALPPITVASTLRSRLVWHMGIEPSSRGTIKNAAFPGLSDLAVPLTSLNELLLIQRVNVQVTADDEDAVLRFDATFGIDPAAEATLLNDEYENLSELGVITEDGVVLLGRQTIARMPYDPLSPIMTKWQQGLRISS